MTRRSPDKRPTVTEVLRLLEGFAQTEDESPATPVSPSASEDTAIVPVFPKYFRGYVYHLFLSLHWQGLLPDSRLEILCRVLLSVIH